MTPRVQRRLYKRIRCSLRGEIVDAGSYAGKCDIADISPRGALLGVSPDIGVPNEFVLCILGTGIKQPVKLMWRAGNKAGVHFIGKASAEIKAAISRGAANNNVLTVNDLIPLKSMPPSNQTSQLRSMASGPASSSALRRQADPRWHHPVIFVSLSIFVAFAGGATFWAVSNWTQAQPEEAQMQASPSEAISSDERNLGPSDPRRDRLTPVIHSIGHMGSTILAPILRAIGKHSPVPVSEENEFPPPQNKPSNGEQGANSPQSTSARQAASSGAPSRPSGPSTPYHPIAAETGVDNFITVSRSASLAQTIRTQVGAEGRTVISFPTLDQLDDANLLSVARCLNSLANPPETRRSPVQFILIDRCLPHFIQNPPVREFSAGPDSIETMPKLMRIAARRSLDHAASGSSGDEIGFRAPE